MRESSERQRKILTELLLRTERLELLLSARQAETRELKGTPCEFTWVWGLIDLISAWTCFWRNLVISVKP